MSAHAVNDNSIDGFPVKVLSAAESHLEASFAPSVGMIGCSLRHRGEELLGQRGGLAKYKSAMSTMGIPLLYPWANRLSGFEYEALGKNVVLDRQSPLLHLDPNGLPIHGLLAASPYWQPVQSTADEDAARVAAELHWGTHRDLMAAFPFAHTLRLEAAVAQHELTITVTVTPSGDDLVPISFGFHPYLAPPGARREEWMVALPVSRRLELDQQLIPTGAGEPCHYETAPLGERTFDDGYDRLHDPPVFGLTAGGRRIELRFEQGYPAAQVFAPPGQDLICFEPMTAITNALVSGGSTLPVVEPGREFVARFAISVTDAP